MPLYKSCQLSSFGPYRPHTCYRLIMEMCGKIFFSETAIPLLLDYIWYAELLYGALYKSCISCSKMGSKMAPPLGHSIKAPIDLKWEKGPAQWGLKK